MRYGEELEQRKARLSSLQSDYAKESENLNTLKSEVVKCIRGESSFSQEMLSGLISDSEAECRKLLDLCSSAEKDVSDSQSVLKELSESYDELISWAELYDNADFEKKKMIVNCLIRRVDVFSDYKLKIDFNFDFQQFINGIECIIKKHAVSIMKRRGSWWR